MYSWQEFLEVGKAHPAAAVPPRADDICTIMYTSGTTGTPKVWPPSRAHCCTAQFKCLVPLSLPKCIPGCVRHDASTVQATLSSPLSWLEWHLVRGVAQGVIITHSIVKACIAATKSHLKHLDDVDDMSESDTFLSFLPLAHIMLSLLSSNNCWGLPPTHCPLEP